MTEPEEITHRQVILVPQRVRPSDVALFGCRLIRTLERKFWIVLIGAALGLGSAHITNELSTPLFKVSSTWSVNVTADPSRVEHNRRSELDIHWPRRARDMLDKRLGADAVWKKLALRPEITAALSDNDTTSPQTALRALRVQLSHEFNAVTGILTLTLTGSNAALAREAANLLPALAFDALVTHRSSLVALRNSVPIPQRDTLHEIRFAHLTVGSLEAGAPADDPQRSALENLIRNPDVWPGNIANPSVRAQFNKLAQANARKETLTKSYQLPPEELVQLNANIASARARVASEARSALSRLSQTPPVTPPTTVAPANTPLQPTAPAAAANPLPPASSRRGNLAGNAPPVVATPDKAAPSRSPATLPSAVSTPALTPPQPPSPKPLVAASPPPVRATSQPVEELSGGAFAVASPLDSDFPFGAISAELVSPAQMPTLPFSPDRRYHLILGMAIGTTAGLIVAMLATMSDEKIVTPGDIEWGFAVPVVGIVPTAKET